MKIYAHRGHGVKYPENTRLAFEKALEEGCDGLHTGLQKSLDGQYLVVNDGNLHRLTGEDCAVWQTDSAQLLRKNILAQDGADYGFNPIMTLDDFLDFIKEKNCPASIEIVSSLRGSDGKEPELALHLQKRGAFDYVVLTAHDHNAIARCHQAAPKGQYGIGAFCQLYDLPEYLRMVGARHLFLSSVHITRELTRAMHAIGAVVHAEYIGNTAELRRLESAGCDIANTPYPQLVGALARGEEAAPGQGAEEMLALGVIPPNASLSGLDISQMRMLAPAHAGK